MLKYAFTHISIIVSDLGCACIFLLALWIRCSLFDELSPGISTLCGKNSRAWVFRTLYRLLCFFRLKKSMISECHKVMHIFISFIFYAAQRNQFHRKGSGEKWFWFIRRFGNIYTPYEKKAMYEIHPFIFPIIRKDMIFFSTVECLKKEQQKRMEKTRVRAATAAGWIIVNMHC